MKTKTLKLLLFLILVFPISTKAASIKYSWERWCSGTCEQTYTLKIDNSSNEYLNNLNPSLTLTGDADEIELINVEGTDGWTATATREGNKITMNFTRDTAINSSSFVIGTLKLKLNNYYTDYAAQLEMNGKITNVLKANTTTTSNGELQNPSTGAKLNIILIATGTIISATLIIIGRKKSKLYKI